MNRQTSINQLTDSTTQSEHYARQLNRLCQCSFDRQAMLRELNDDNLYRMLVEEREHLFADAVMFVSEATVNKQREIIAAIEAIIALPAYQQRVLADAPVGAQFQPKAHSVFFGYDFHLDGNGQPQLIEINTNAGGALLNAILSRSQQNCCHPGSGTAVELESVFMAMFLNEWRAERQSEPLRTLAIVDENPPGQYMWPEFVLFQMLFARHQIQTVICDPGELEYRTGKLWYRELAIDLIYNRLTDFCLEQPAQQAILTAYLDNAVVVTPHPRAYTLYANKKNLALLTDATALQRLGVDNKTIETLLNGIAHTVPVNSADDAEELWAQRKKWFFKPASGYGSKAAYRGDKLTKRVFNEILGADYVAQTLVHPSERQLQLAGQKLELKVDLRHYVYQGQTQLVSARLYQGQTTNFRTPGGGFAKVVIVA